MNPLEKLQREFENNRGVRIGHTAVVSRKVHTVNPVTPGKINIIVNADAGRVFYHRLKENEIVHIDLFHEIATFDIKQLAESIKKRLLQGSMDHVIDYIDIQTGSGGGKLTGTLDYGKTESLKKNHLNHVHIAALISDQELNNLFLLVASVEEALKAQNVELRKIECIKHEMGNSPMDMSPYATDSDTNMKQEGATSRDEGGFRDSVELIEHFGGLREIEEVFDALSNTGDSDSGEKKKEFSKNNSEFDDIIKHLDQKGLLNKRQNRHYLSNSGEKLREFIRLNRKELEMILKKTIKNSPKLDNYTGLEAKHFSQPTGKSAKGPCFSELYDPEEGVQELDVTSTVRRSVIRSYLQNTKFNVEQEDIVCIKRKPRIQQDICLIIDASASMAGYRLRNAKFLAKNLILRPYTRLSVLAFQEKEVINYVPFTRNYNILEEGLGKIVSTGLTPLALALDKSLLYMGKKHLKNPLIILITDGIPTVALWTSDPIKDAICAANNIAEKKIGFCCIGLQPNKESLVKITEAAKGKLYVLDELNREVLVDITRKSGQLL